MGSIFKFAFWSRPNVPQYLVDSKHPPRFIILMNKCLRCAQGKGPAGGHQAQVQPHYPYFPELVYFAHFSFSPEMDAHFPPDLE